MLLLGINSLKSVAILFSWLRKGLVYLFGKDAKTSVLHGFHLYQN